MGFSAFGDIEPENRIISTSEYRFYFLLAIEDICPEVLQALYEDGYLIFDRLVKPGDENKFYPLIGLLGEAPEEKLKVWDVEEENLVSIKTWEKKREQYKKEPGFLPVKKALQEWGGRFHLGDDWLLETALETVAWWRAHWRSLPPGHENAKLEWAPRFFCYKKRTGEKFSIELPEWDYVLYTEKEAKDWYMKQFEVILEDYLETTKKESNWIPAKKKRNREHFDWLVRYVVQGWSYEEIAQEYTDADPFGDAVISEDAIRKAVTATAKLVGLKLRD